MYVVRAPDHLGDGVMAQPAVAALAALGEVRVYAPGWGRDVYAGLDVRPRDEVPATGTGVLLKPSFGAAWRWRHLPRRVGLASAGRGVLLTDALPLREEHRRAGYARVAAHLGATVSAEPPPVRARPADGFVALNPWSPTATVRWPHYRALADRLAARAPLVFFAGPGEERAVADIAGPHALRAGLPLPDFAAALEGCRVFVSNDSGAAHFAAARGVPVVMIHGSTASARTGVGAPVERDGPWCRPCYRKSCPFALGCLARIDVDTVEAEVARVLGAGAAGGAA